MGLAQGHTRQPPGLIQGCRLSQAASVTLSGTLGPGTDLRPRWRRSSRGTGAQRAVVIAPKQHSTQGKSLPEHPLPSALQSGQAGPSVRNAHSRATSPSSLNRHLSTDPSPQYPHGPFPGPFMGTPTLSWHRGGRAGTDGPAGDPNGKGEEVTHRGGHAVSQAWWQTSVQELSGTKGGDGRFSQGVRKRLWGALR